MAGLATIAGGWIRPVQRADNAARHGEAEAKRVAEGQHSLSRVELGRVTPGHAGQARCVYFNDREVGERVGAYEFCRQDLPVAHGHVDVHCAVNDVIIGDDVSVGRNNHATAEAVLDPGLGLHRHAELTSERSELLHVLRVFAGAKLRVGFGRDRNIHDRGSNACGERFHCLIE